MNESVSSASSYKAWLADYIEYQASWREEKAEQYPDDERNTQSARCLQRLAENLRNLPDHNFDLLTISAVEMGIPGEVEPDEEGMDDRTATVQEAVRTYGFHHEEDGDAEAFLKRLGRLF